MTLPVHWVPSLVDATVGSTVEVTGDEAHHAVAVRRLRVGESVVLTDGRGRSVTGPVARDGQAGVLGGGRIGARRRACARARGDGRAGDPEGRPWRAGRRGADRGRRRRGSCPGPPRGGRRLEGRARRRSRSRGGAPPRGRPPSRRGDRGSPRSTPSPRPPTSRPSSPPPTWPWCCTRRPPRRWPRLRRAGGRLARRRGRPRGRSERRRGGEVRGRRRARRTPRVGGPPYLDRRRRRRGRAAVADRALAVSEGRFQPGGGDSVSVRARETDPCSPPPRANRPSLTADRGATRRSASRAPRWRRSCRGWPGC